MAFCLKSSENAKAVNAKIYKNSVAIGTERANSTMTYVCYQESFSHIYPGDNIQLYAKDGGAGATVYVNNFKISYNKATSTEDYIVTN